MRLALLALALLLVVPATAHALDAPQVITDPAAETESPPAGDQYADEEQVPAADDGTPPAEPPPPDASGRRGEIHILGATSSSAPAAALRVPTASPRATLPFTGLDPAPLAGTGLLLLGAGLALRRRARAPRTRPCPR